MTPREPAFFCTGQRVCEITLSRPETGFGGRAGELGQKGGCPGLCAPTELHFKREIRLSRILNHIIRLEGVFMMLESVPLVLECLMASDGATLPKADS